MAFDKTHPEKHPYQAERVFKNDTQVFLDASGKPRTDASVELAADGKQRVFFVNSQLHVELPTDRERANAFIFAGVPEGTKKHELAKHYDVSPAYFSMIIGSNTTHTITRNMLLIAALSLNTPMDRADVEHALMEVNRPGLYTLTGNPAVNRRNHILLEIFTYARKYPCPVSDWVVFAQTVLARLNMELLSKSTDRDALLAENLTPEIARLADDWNRKAPQDKDAVSVKAFRQFLLKRYHTSRSPHLSKTELYYCLADAIPSSYDTLLPIFNGSQNGSRELLICLADILDCTLDEANRLLMEVNYPLIYPMREDSRERAVALKLYERQKNTKQK